MAQVSHELPSDEGAPRKAASSEVTAHRIEGFRNNVLYPFVLWSFERRIGDRFPLDVTKAIKGREKLTGKEREVIEEVSRRDWSASSLHLDNDEDVELAAQATALGGVLVYGFGNFYAVAAHPCQESVVHVNCSKGRPPTQVGSLTTTKEHIKDIFDWSKVPVVIGSQSIMELIDEFYEMGPFGFRGPAAAGLPEILTNRDGEQITTQIIAPGYKCPSNKLLRRVLELTDKKYIFITSANLSHNTTGTTEEPAHYRISGIQRDFGKKPGYIMVSHSDEDKAIDRFKSGIVSEDGKIRRYEPMSTTIVGFNKVTLDENENPVLFLERHGSLHESDVRDIIKQRGYGLTNGPKAQSRLPLRYY